MTKLKKTKQELKVQRRALERYYRYLPTLELKKQQLQREARQVETMVRQRRAQEEEVWRRVRPWIKLLSAGRDLGSYVELDTVELDSVNIAGVTVPTLTALRFTPPVIDYYATPPWLEDAIAALRELTTLRVEQEVLGRQREALAEELRITAQRVNLFEKVMIPRAQENVRIIQIALGDAQTAAVARAKLAKRKSLQLRSGKASG